MARKRQETLVLFKDVLTITRKLSDAQFGALMRAAFAYRFEGEEYSGEDALVEMAFLMLESQIDRYREVCDTNCKNAKHPEREAEEAPAEPREIGQEEAQEEAPVEIACSDGERNAAESSEMQQNAPHTHIHTRTHNHTRSHTHNHIHTRTHDAGNEKLPLFSPPSVEEVRAYVREKKLNIDSTGFVNYFTANDWHLGEKKMRDWRLAARVWSDSPGSSAVG